MKTFVFLQQATSIKASLKKTTLALSLVALMGTGLTACDKHTKEEHKHDEHAHAEHDEHSHEEHEAHDHDEKHEHEHEHDEKVGHIGKHVHGEAELNAVIEGNSLNLELNSPSMNVFGFEHEPSTAEQKATVEKQEAVLENAAKLFVIDGGDCAVKTVKVNMPFDEHAHDEEHEHAEHHHDDDEHEADEHGKDEHEAHEHEEHQHAEGEVHSDVSATYSYDCQNAADVKSIQVQFFNQFTGFTKINTNWVNGDKQGAQTLTKDAYNIVVK